MSKVLDAVLLLALPASGKSEVRKYLKSLSPESAAKDFHMGDSVQLDDFPYVHMMRRIDDELAANKKDRIFFHSPDRPFRDTLHWGTLIELLNEDYEDLVNKKIHDINSAANLLLDRLDKAFIKVGGKSFLNKLDTTTRKNLETALGKEARAMLIEKQESYPNTLEGKTLVIEFARGGPDGAPKPLSVPLGYQYSIGKLSQALLQRASILYIWVTSEESRRKNDARTDPNDPGSILHHGVPIEVMMNDYGTDDMDYLESVSEKPGTIPIKAHGKTFHIPIARFDNRVDKTTFIREDKSKWKQEDVSAVHNGLKGALDKLISFSK